jgi:NAD(P)-dependent dehydrogenase (short-subunit alcohol dehydrogenase family)
MLTDPRINIVNARCARSIVITGAASGIGAACVRALTDDCNLTLSDVRVISYTRHPFLLTDVCGVHGMRQLANFAIEKYGSIDAWIHCAGRGINRRTFELNPSDMIEMFHVNSIGTLNALQACVPHFRRAGRGCFLAVSSALVGEPARSPHRSAYTVSKAAMEMMLDIAQEECIAQKYSDIHISFLRLPGVDTNFSRAALHAAPGAVSSSPTLLTADEAASLLVARLHEAEDHVRCGRHRVGLSRQALPESPGDPVKASPMSTPIQPSGLRASPEACGADGSAMVGP